MNLKFTLLGGECSFSFQQDSPVGAAPFDLDPGGGLIGSGGGGKGGGILAVRSCPNFSFKMPDDDKAESCEEKSPMIV